MESDSERGERIETVQAVEADEDRLVSVAVPHDETLGEYLEEAEEAHREAEVLDDQANEPLREALEGTVRVLHDVENTPEDGLAAYVGVVDGDLTSFVFEDPPGRVTEGVFETGNEFVTDPLEHGERTDRTVGLIVVERGGAAVGRLRGEGVETLETLDSDVPGKTRAGSPRTGSGGAARSGSASSSTRWGTSPAGSSTTRTRSCSGGRT